MKPRIAGHPTEAVVVTRGASRSLVRLQLLPGCCPPNGPEHTPIGRATRWRPLPCEVKNGPLNGAAPRSLPRSIPEFSCPRWSVGDRCSPVVHTPAAVPQRSESGLQPLHPLKRSRAASCGSRNSEPLGVPALSPTAISRDRAPTGAGIPRPRQDERPSGAREWSLDG